MEAKAKITKEILCEEARFILANVMAESKYGKQNSYEDIRRVCEGAVSLPFTQYVEFLETAGYLSHDVAQKSLEVSGLGEEVVNGGSLSDLTEAAVAHFRNLRERTRRKKESAAPSSRDILSSSGSISTSGDLPSELKTSSSRSGSAALDRMPTSLKEAGADREALDARYRTMTAIGAGGIATVFRAEQLSLKRDVALKEIRELFTFFSPEQRPEIVRRFAEAVQAHAGLAHPNILQIHDVNVDAEFPYLVAELCPNGSLRRLIEDAESIPVGLVLRYFLQTLHALQAAHGKLLSHQGLKPENMLIDAQGNLKISDFGFSRIVQRDKSTIRQVYVGMGTVAYMAPELFAEPTDGGPQADIYALGIIFYELLTRKLPGRRSPMPSEIDPSIPTAIDDIFDLMTRDSRSERYSCVDDILEDFSKVDQIQEVMGDRMPVRVDNPLEELKFRAKTAVDTLCEPEKTSADSAGD